MSPESLIQSVLSHPISSVFVYYESIKREPLAFPRKKNPFVFFTSNQNLLKFYIHYMASKDFPIIHMQKYNQVYEKILKIAIHEELFTKPVMHFGRFQKHSR